MDQINFGHVKLALESVDAKALFSVKYTNNCL